MSYRNYLSRLFPIALRFCVLLLGKAGQLKKFPGDATRCKNILKQLGNFKPLLSSKQLLILQTFCQKVHESATSPADADVLEFIHEFLVDVFNDSYSLTEEVSCVIEQVVIVCCLTENTDGMWRSARWMYGVISSYFRIIKSTLVQVAILGGADAKYKRLPPSSIIKFAAEDSEEAEVDVHQLDLDEIAFVRLLDEDLDQEPEMDDADESNINKSFDSVLK